MTSYEQLVERLQNLGIWNGSEMNDEAYFTAMGIDPRAVQQEQMYPKISLEMYLHNLSGDMSDERGLGFLDLFPEDPTPPPQGSNNDYYVDGVPTFGDPAGFSDVSIDGGKTWGQDTDISDGVQGATNGTVVDDDPGGYVPNPLDPAVIPEDYAFTSRAGSNSFMNAYNKSRMGGMLQGQGEAVRRSTPYADAYIKAKEEEKKTGDVRRMFADVIGE